MDDVLLPLPRSVKFTGVRTRTLQTPCTIVACQSNRVRQYVLQLNLGGLKFSCHVENLEADRHPSIDDDYQYSLSIAGSTINLHAHSEQGALAGCSTLAQLSSQDSLPNCEIHDKPQHEWRGLLIDVSRHYMSLKTLRSVVDLLHHFKMNVLHLHLTDDQAFRFQSTAFPKLVAQEHYSKEDLKSLVEYAADRAVRIVPEIDIPGHVTSWLVAYPEWGTEAVGAEELLHFGPHEACLDPSNEVAVQSVISILEEVVETFSDQYVHIGGDEVDPSWWNRSETVQRWAEERGFSNAQDIQANFTKRIVEELESRDKKVIVWDEALHESLPQTVLVQAWRGMQARDTAVDSGYQTLVSSPYYLDLNYPVTVHYGYTPTMPTTRWKAQDSEALNLPVLDHVRDGIEWHQTFGKFPDLLRRSGGSVVGGEACMWSELVSDELLLKRVWTRLPAIAEHFWGVPESRSIDDVYNRLEVALTRLPNMHLPDVLACPRVHECQELLPLLEMLEPVKWYARTLSTSGTESRVENQAVDPKSRPYNARTPLGRVVDRLPPESLAARRCGTDVLAGKSLDSWTTGWRSQHESFESACVSYPELEELRDASTALAQLADVAAGVLSPNRSLAGPFGEYLLPIALVFCGNDDS